MVDDRKTISIVIGGRLDGGPAAKGAAFWVNFGKAQTRALANGP